MVVVTKTGRRPQRVGHTLRDDASTVKWRQKYACGHEIIIE